MKIHNLLYGNLYSCCTGSRGVKGLSNGKNRASIRVAPWHKRAFYYGMVVFFPLTSSKRMTRRMYKLAFARLCIEVCQEFKPHYVLSIVLQGSYKHSH